MTIPNSFSFEDLQKAMQNAPSDTQLETRPSQSDEEYKHKIMETAQRHCTAAFEELADPVLHKAMACVIFQNLISYHERRSQNAYSESETQVAASWARDSGQLIAALSILLDTSVSPDDFFPQS